MNWLIYVLAAAAGAANPAQAAANAELKKVLGQVLTATTLVYITGFLGMLVIHLITRHALPTMDKFAAVPWWAWTGGLISIAATISGAAFAQRLGSGVFTGISVTAALVMSIVLDHFGWMGFKQHPASWQRIVGGALMIAGLWITSKF